MSCLEGSLRNHPFQKASWQNCVRALNSYWCIVLMWMEVKVKASQPLGDSVYGPLVIRLALGAYFLIGGLAKYSDPDGFMAMVRKVGLFPEPFETLYGILFPYLEILVGALLVIGIWTTLTAIIASLLLVSLVFSLGIFPYSGQFTRDLFNKDLILLAAAFSLAYTGSGALSVDRFRKSG